MATPQSEGAWPKSLYIFYSHHKSTAYNGSFYKLDLPHPGPESEPELDPELESDSTIHLRNPIVVFPSDAMYARDMRCARLGSKVYFLGGHLTTLPPDKLIYTRDVYVLDLAAPDSAPATKLPALLNAGKPNPMVFVAENKVFVLGSWATIMGDRTWFPDGSAWHSILGLSSIAGKLFECYDPDVGEWQVLEEPPGDYQLVLWKGHIVFESSRLVVLFPEEGVPLVYDLSTSTWAPLSQGGNRLPDRFLYDISTFNSVTTSQLPCRFAHRYSFITPYLALGYFSGYFLYGVDDWGVPMKSKFNLRVAEDSDSKRFYVCEETSKDIEIQVVNHDYVFHHPFLFCAFHLYSLGDGYFCHVTTGEIGRSDSSDSLGFSPTDGCTRAIKVVVFKEIKNNDFEHNVSYFKVEALYSKIFLINTSPAYNLGTLVSAFVVSHDELQKMKKTYEEEEEGGEEH